MHPLIVGSSRNSLPIHFTTPSAWPMLSKELPGPARNFAAACGFEATAGRHLILPDEEGQVAGMLFGLGNDAGSVENAQLAGKLADVLTEGIWHFATLPPDPARALLAILLGAYAFDRYRKTARRAFRIVLPKGVDGAEISRIADGVWLGRDLVNTPAGDLLPHDLEAAARSLAREHGADLRTIAGDDLLKRNFPLIHAVGRASASPPRLVDIRWGRPKHPMVTLVGKGVCFDTGGLDIKPSSGMLLMKKDMGGAAAALAAAQMIMAAKLRVRLRVLLPIVENAISGNAFRPGDILQSRKGLTVEIGNTDAEGRLILADALTLADEEAPALLIDFATLTGAARVALGPDLPPFYTEDAELAGEVVKAGELAGDPVWRLPLWKPYHEMLRSKFADINNSGQGGMAGSITAALFLARFVEKTRAWAHFDIYAWNPSARPGRPEGGEVQAARLTYKLVAEKFG